MIPTDALPGLYRQTKVERLDRIGIPLGWARSVEPLRPYAANLTMLLGTSGTGRDSLLDAIRSVDPMYDRIRRITTRSYRAANENGRILSMSDDAFAAGALTNRIICPFFYPANGQRYGVSVDELTKLRNGPALLEGTSELIPLKILLPEAKLFVVLPENLDQVRGQLASRDGGGEETRRRLQQATRELCSLVVRLQQLMDDGIVDGIIQNASPLSESAERAYRQIQGNVQSTKIPEELTTDVLAYLSSWSAI